MLAGVLKNDIAIQVSISIIRAFIEMRKKEIKEIIKKLINWER